MLHTRQKVETWQGKRHAGKRRPWFRAQKVAGFFVSVQQLSFIEQGCGWMMEKAREGRGRHFGWKGGN